MLSVKGPFGFALVKRVRFNLINGRNDAVVQHQIHYTVGVEVGNTDGADFTRLYCRLHCPPRAMHIAIRLVDQIQIQIIQAEFLQRSVDGFGGGGLTGILHPQLGGDEHIITRHTAFI